MKFMQHRIIFKGNQNMSEGSIEDIRRIGEKYIKDYLGISSGNFTGISDTTDFGNLKNKYELFSDTAYIRSFLNFNEVPVSDENCSNRLSIFLARHCVFNSSSEVTDNINRLECNTVFKERNKVYTARYLDNLIPFNKSTEERKRLNNLRKEPTGEMKPLYSLFLQNNLSSIKELGFKDLNHFYISFLHPESELLISTAVKLLSDTEYLYKDLLKWYTKKKLQMEISTLKKYDLDFLVNSYELTDRFPNHGYHYILDTGMGKIPGEYPENLVIDDAEKHNKVCGVSVFPLNPPFEIKVGFYPVRGIAYYLYLMGGCGKAQCYSHIDRDEHFEFRYLADPKLEYIFENLFLGLVYEPKWIKKVLGYLPDSDLMRFICFRKLKELREISLNLSFLTNIADPERIGEYYESFREQHLKVLLCDTDEYRFFGLLKDPGKIIESFSGLLGSSVLRYYLLNRYDQQWWRTEECGEYLRGIWGMGGRADFLFLEKDIKLELVDINYLYNELNTGI